MQKFMVELQSMERGIHYCNFLTDHPDHEKIRSNLIFLTTAGSTLIAASSSNEMLMSIMQG